MATVPLSYKNAAARSVPAFEVLDLWTDTNLTAGAEPPIPQPVRILLDDSLTLAQFTVVGLAAGKLVKAVWHATVASGVVPIGVLMQAATSAGSNTTIYGEVALGGCFNAGEDATGTDSPLVWDSSSDTLAKKTTWAGLVGNPDLLFRSRAGANAT